MAILKYLLALAFSLLLTGCYEDIEPNIETEPVLCINSMITAGEPIEVMVSHSWMFNNENGEKNHSVEDAKISIYANGMLQTENYIPKEGDNIRIVAESKKYGSAEASVTVPEAVPINSVDFSPVVLNVFKNSDLPMSEGLTFNMKISMKIVDTHSYDDYFKLDYNWASQTGDDDDGVDYNAPHAPYTFFSFGTFEYKAEPIFEEYIGMFESVMGNDYDDALLIFSDRQFSRKDYTLRLQFNNASYLVESPEYDSELYDCSITFYLATVSRSYYDRAIYVWQRDSGIIGDLGDLGFAEPIWGYSNVSSGAGIVAARSFSTYTLNLKDFIQQTLNSNQYSK